MGKYRIYIKGDNLPMHTELYLELPIKISIGETLTYSGTYKIVDVIHHISEDTIITDLHVEKIK